jgi:predicted nuclease with TOPRIM domain
MSRVEDAIQELIDDHLSGVDYAEQDHLESLESRVDELNEKIQDLESVNNRLKEIVDDQLEINADVVDQFKLKVQQETGWIQELIVNELPGAVLKLLKRFISKTEEGGN